MVWPGCFFLLGIALVPLGAAWDVTAKPRTRANVRNSRFRRIGHPRRKFEMGRGYLPTWGRHSCLPALQAGKNACPTSAKAIGLLVLLLLLAGDDLDFADLLALDGEDDIATLRDVAE